MQVLTLTQAAQDHFQALLAQEGEDQELNLRITVTDPGTPKADVGITFCPMGEHEHADLAMDYQSFKLFIAQEAITALKDAVIDFKTDGLNGQLTVKAPFIRGCGPAADAPLRERVQYIIDTEVNPNLAAHGGLVRLEDITESNVVLLGFGGGCHGCGMADVTMKTGIEKTLLQRCPDITAVKDITDHATGTNPYYS